MLEDYKEILLKIGFNQPIIIPISAKAASLFKQEDSVLDEDDIFEKELLQNKFEKDYYDLSHYIGCEKNTSLLAKTGILQLETTIIN